MALVVGVGNPMRRDDGVGPAVARRVASLHIPGVHVEVGAEPLALLDHLPRRDTVVVVDAAAPGPRPGTVSVLTLGGRPLSRRVPALAPHGLGLAEVVELARALGPLPTCLVLVTVEAGDVTLGVGLTPAVADHLDDAVAAVLAALAPSDDAPLTG
jgi:hydrogenase maturation protease